MTFTWTPIDPQTLRLQSGRCVVVAAVMDRGRVLALFTSESRAMAYAKRLNRIMEPANG